MKSILSVLIVAATLSIAANAQTSAASQSEKLNKLQLASLIASANTPPEHLRIANYYAAKAQDDLAQSNEHATMAEQYKKNSVASSSKWSAGTVNHCEWLAQSLKEDAARMNDLARQHEQMAKVAQQ